MNSEQQQDLLTTHAALIANLHFVQCLVKVLLRDKIISSQQTSEAISAAKAALSSEGSAMAIRASVVLERLEGDH